MIIDPKVFVTPACWLSAAGIFVMLVGNQFLDTFRILFVTHGEKKKTWVAGFFQLIIYTFAISAVLSGLENFLNVVGYAAGSATGGILAMILEEKLAIGHIHMRIVSPNYGQAIADCLRRQGFAITETSGSGMNGAVSVLHCGVMRRDVPVIKEMVENIDGSAFIVANEVRSFQYGFWHISKKPLSG